MVARKKPLEEVEKIIDVRPAKPKRKPKVVEVPKDEFPDGHGIDVPKEAGQQVNKWKQYVASFGFIHNGGQFKHAGNTACHAELGYPGVEKIEAVVNGIQNLKVPEATARRFLEYLFNFSAYAPAIKTKSVKRAMDDGYYVGDVEVPGNLLGGALIAGRAISEYKSLAIVWEKLVERGVDPNMAFVVSHSLQISGTGDLSFYTWGGHTAFSGTEEGAKFINFTKKEMQKPIEVYAKIKRYNPTNTLWNGGKPAPKLLTPLLRKAGDELKGVNKSNPFADINVRSQGMKVDVAIEAFAPIIIEYTKENVGV